MPKPAGYIDVNMGRLTKEQASNIARELKYLWRYTGDIRPNGDKKQAADLRVTVDSFGQYHFYLNVQAIRLVLGKLRDIIDLTQPTGKQATPDCPPEVPDFLRWDEHSTAGSQPSPKPTDYPQTSPL